MARIRKSPPGCRNIVGAKVARLRKEQHIKQKDFVARLQSMGMDISDTSMSRLEGQTRLVQDFELPCLAQALGISIEELLSQDD